MTDDIVMSLQQLQRYAVGMRDLFVQAQTSAPERVAATDASGAVRAVLDANGLPESIVVESDWRRRLVAGGLAAAVMEACQAAASERMAVVSQTLHDEETYSRADRLRESLVKQVQPTPVDPLPAQLRDQLNRVQPRPLEDLAEDVLRAADDIDSLAAASSLTAVGTGTDASGRMVITVSRLGLVSCEAEPRWLGMQSETLLTVALNEAIGMARANLARASQQADTAGGLNQLFVETLAILDDLQKRRPARS